LQEAAVGCGLGIKKEIKNIGANKITRPIKT
jgi:hypothetical protein